MSNGVNEREEPAPAAKRIYLSGPMTGIADFNYPKFGERAAAWRKAGWTVENPAEHFGGSMIEARSAYMRADIADLLNVDAIGLLAGWEGSKGARLEVMIAAELGLAFFDAESMKLIPVPEVSGRSPAEVPPNWRTSELVNVQRNLIATKMGHEYLADNHDLLDELCAAVWRSAQLSKTGHK